MPTEVTVAQVDFGPPLSRFLVLLEGSLHPAENGSRQHMDDAIDWDNVDDGELLFYMAFRDEAAAEAREAWHHFHDRHAKYVLGVCRRLARDAGALLDDRGAEDLAGDTLVRAYERAETFTTKEEDPVVVRRQVQAWLGVIARNIMRSVLRGRMNRPDVEDVDMDQIRARAHPASEPQVALVNKALETLSDKECRVLRATAHWYDEDRGYFNPPKGVMEELARELGALPVSLRKIRERALRKLREYIEHNTGEDRS